MKIEKKTQLSSSVEIGLSVPTQWEQLTEKQLRYIYFLRCNNCPDIEVQTMCFIRFNNIEVLDNQEEGWLCRIRYSWRKTSSFFYLKAWEIREHLKHLEFLNEPGTSIIRLEKIGKYRAIDSELHGLIFDDYLIAENYYQGYIHIQDEYLLRELAALLYRDKKGKPASRIKMNEVERYSVLQWYFSVKVLFAEKFPYFFQRIDKEESENPEEVPMPDMEAMMNAEIRALTGGDITKEKEILSMDTWRALTELNEKAREAKELEKNGRTK